MISGECAKEERFLLWAMTVHKMYQYVDNETRGPEMMAISC